MPTESATAPAASHFFIILSFLPKDFRRPPRSLAHCIVGLPLQSASVPMVPSAPLRPHLKSQRRELFYRPPPKDSGMPAVSAHRTQPSLKSRIFCAAQHRNPCL